MLAPGFFCDGCRLVPLPFFGGQSLVRFTCLRDRCYKQTFPPQYRNRSPRLVPSNSNTMIWKGVLPVPLMADELLEIDTLRHLGVALPETEAENWSRIHCFDNSDYHGPRRWIELLDEELID